MHIVIFLYNFLKVVILLEVFIVVCSLFHNFTLCIVIQLTFYGVLAKTCLIFTV